MRPVWKVVLGVVLVAVAIVILFTTVFPWVESWQQDPTMGGGHDPVAAQLARWPR